MDEQEQYDPRQQPDPRIPFAAGIAVLLWDLYLDGVEVFDLTVNNEKNEVYFSLCYYGSSFSVEVDFQGDRIYITLIGVKTDVVEGFDLRDGENPHEAPHYFVTEPELHELIDKLKKEDELRLVQEHEDYLKTIDDAWSDRFN